MKEKIFDVDFVCPDCGHTVLEEKREGIVSYAEIDSFFQNDDGETYCENTREIKDYDDLSEISLYMCQRCSHIIATDAANALDWLKKQGMLKEKSNETTKRLASSTRR